MGRILDRLVDCLRRQAKQCADTGGDSRAEMPDMVDVEAIQGMLLAKAICTS